MGPRANLVFTETTGITNPFKKFTARCVLHDDGQMGGRHHDLQLVDKSSEFGK